MLKLDQLEGNDTVKGYLKTTLEKGTVASSWLFEGSAGVGKFQFAQTFASELLLQNDPSGHQSEKLMRGNHPDFHVYRPEGKTGIHPIDKVRQLTNEVYLYPFEASKKIFIIDQAEKMLKEATNALLKTFEEPPEDTVIILVSSQSEQLLPTITSRCRRIYFRSNLSDVTLKDLSDASKNLLSLLVQGGVSSYSDLINFCSKQQLALDEKKKAVEKEFLEGQKKKYPDLTAIQQETLNKELEGIKSQLGKQHIDQLLEVVLHWYRDLEMLFLTQDVSKLKLPTFQLKMEDAILNAQRKPLEEVYGYIQEAKLAFQRSISLHLCLEGLLMKLNFI